MSSTSSSSTFHHLSSSSQRRRAWFEENCLVYPNGNPHHDRHHRQSCWSTWWKTCPLYPLFANFPPKKRYETEFYLKLFSVFFFLLLFFHISIFFKLSQDSDSENTGRPGDPLRDSRSHFNPTPLLTRLSCSLGNSQVRIWQRSKKKIQICFLVHFITWQEKVMSSRGWGEGQNGFAVQKESRLSSSWSDLRSCCCKKKKKRLTKIDPTWKITAWWEGKKCY